MSDVSTVLSPHDMLVDFFTKAFAGDKQKALTAYFESGESCATKFAELCREAPPTSVLEFASGYGRVSRFAKKLMPGTNWTCCDIHPQAVEFISTQLGLPAFLSTTDPADFRTEGKFQVVFALSFFSHMPHRTFGPWLAKLMEAIEPGGHLIFTTHGAVSLAKMFPREAVFDEAGFFWLASSEQHDLDSNDYGSSAATFDNVHRALVSHTQGRLVRFHEAYWWEHQDLYVVRKP